MKKGVSNEKLFLISLFVFVLVGGSLVFAYNSSFIGGDPNVVGHSSGNVYIEACGTTMDLSEATRNVVVGLNGSVSHDARKIGIKVGEEIKTLQELFSGSEDNSSDPSIDGHSADEIGVTVNGASKTLQQAYDDGDFNNIINSNGYTCPTWCSEASGSLTPSSGSAYFGPGWSWSTFRNWANGRIGYTLMGGAGAVRCDGTTLTKLCNLAGYQNYASPACGPFGSCGDNQVGYFSGGSWRVYNACNYNSIVWATTCTNPYPKSTCVDDDTLEIRNVY